MTGAPHAKFALRLEELHDEAPAEREVPTMPRPRRSIRLPAPWVKVNVFAQRAGCQRCGCSRDLLIPPGSDMPIEDHIRSLAAFLREHAGCPEP